ncbi:AAA family ATPase [Parasalinivibrio latis]
MSLTHQDVYREASLSLLESKTTKTLEPLDEIIGQDRAKQAVAFAMSMKEKGYNIYAIGANGLGKRTMILRYLNRHQKDDQTVYDWCYVANFKEAREPKVLCMPAGQGSEFRSDIEKLMTKLVKSLPLAFDNELYFARSEKLKTQLSQKQETALAAMNEEALKKHVSLSITAQGEYEFVAMNGEEPHTEETFMALTSKERAKFESSINHLELKLRNLVRELTEWEDDFSEKVQKLNEETALSVVAPQVKNLKEKYHGITEVKTFLGDMQKDIVDNLDIFLQASDEQSELSYATLEKKLPRRYQVNVMVSHAHDNFPVVVEESPNYHTIFGYTENATYKGTVFTDFSLIRAGSLHKANGGVLLMDAIKVLERPYVWDGLKRALRSRQLNMNSLEREVTLTGTISMEPEPIPLNVKIILFGDYHTYQLLQHYDAEFGELFRVTADFEDDMNRTDASELQYARFISSIVHDNGMLHCDRQAIGRIIEFSSRQVADQNKLSLHSADIANLLRESNYWAKEAGSTTIRGKHVEKALESQENRVSRLRDNVMENFINGVTLMETKGKAIGQVNALSVITTNDHSFGAPNRITATVSYGKGEVLDIERKVRMGGNIHSKGVMILSAYLASLFGKEQKIPLTTHLTFEQNYGGVDGDSASMAELCAIVSAFSGLPMRQDIAITGSMNQFGQAQPIGGVNEKIEGFFDVCGIKGRKSTQGVIIPRTNVHHLMLRKDVRQAIEKGTFHIWAIDHVSEAVELFMGRPSGIGAKKISEDSVIAAVFKNLDKLRDEQ